ncbi:MAG: ECF transporter S component [Kurthia sp.]|nr:ECF transporter S component [Candidatus Kurthia equi]
MTKKQAISAILLVVVIPLILLIGATLLEDGKYNIISMLVAIIACIPFFLSFEKRKPDAREILVIAVMSAISVAGRAVFAWIPGFKPVTALTAITGFKLGPEAGFLTGAVSAISSNILFGQGPWTPFQMFTWGMLGYIAGWLGKTKWMERKLGLILYGIVAGVLFSFIMDIWTVISYDGHFNWRRYMAAAGTALPFTATYVLSNVVFLLLLTKPIGEKLERMKVKYGIMQPNSK